MVASDFGKLDVKRHLISGEDCAIAGEAIAVAAAPAAETFKKSRRFIQAYPHWGVHPGFPGAFPCSGANMASSRGLWRAVFNTEIHSRNTRRRHDCTD